MFKQESAAAAKAAVEELAAQGIIIDSRKEYVRIGLGPNHTLIDIEALLQCLCT